MIDELTIRSLAQQRIDEKHPGCFIVDISIDPLNRISVELDHFERGISIEECVSVSRNIEHNLDREVEDFELEVSSAGIGRPFKVWPQYLKNVGRTLKVITYQGEVLEGVLKFAENHVIEIESETLQKLPGQKKKEKVISNHSISIELIKEASIIITFK